MSETPKIPTPETIVVSGDLIQGVEIGASNWKQSIDDQYKVAGEFLTELCERFLGGDRRRLILVPGNHDVCWNTSREAMKLVPTNEYPNDIYRALAKSNSLYRWSWRELALYRIANVDLYEQRLNSYWNFVESFYQEANLEFKIKRDREYQLFELNDKRIIVVAFNSVAGNDCFNKTGLISQGVVEKCDLELRDYYHTYNLRIGVWHHSIKGAPNQTDYMDRSIVQRMTSFGFQLGLHGHQHKAETLTEFVHLDQTNLMPVISAGSLCAGAKELPRGVNRQYNLIVIENDYKNARIHVREMGESEQFTSMRSGEFLNGFVKVCMQPSTDIMGRKIDAQKNNTRRSISDAERNLKNGNFEKVVSDLKNIDFSTEIYARQILIEALRRQESWQSLVEFLQDPMTQEEKVLKISALMRLNRFDEAENELFAASNQLNHGIHNELSKRLRIKKLMKK